MIYVVDWNTVFCHRFYDFLRFSPTQASTVLGDAEIGKYLKYVPVVPHKTVIHVTHWSCVTETENGV